jgi:hypothetical protein
MRILIILFSFSAVCLGTACSTSAAEKTIELPDVQGRIDHLSIDLKGERLSLPPRQ